MAAKGRALALPEKEEEKEEEEEGGRKKKEGKMCVCVWKE